MNDNYRLLDNPNIFTFIRACICVPEKRMNKHFTILLENIKRTIPESGSIDNYLIEIMDENIGLFES